VQFHDEYWQQNGDIVRGILEAPKNKQGQYDYQDGKPDYAEAVTQLRRITAPFNYEAERVHFLDVLQDTLVDARREKAPDDYQKLLKAYLPLRSELEAMSLEAQPIQNGVADKAVELLRILSEVERSKEEVKAPGKVNPPFFRSKL
jgi:hypothetical protein